MIRCIQVGRSTVQGHVTAVWPDPAGEHGAILSMGRVVMGKLTPQHRAEPKRARYGDEDLAAIKRWMDETGARPELSWLVPPCVEGAQ